MKFSSRAWVVGLLMVALFSAGTAWAQAGTSSIRGTVTDPEGRVLPGATVTLTHDATQATRTTTTTETGSYRFELLTPGDYTVVAEAPGFSRQQVTGVRAQVGQATDVPVAMAVGAAVEVIEVRAATASVTVNTQDATLGNNFVSAQIASLPMEALNIGALLTLQPGVTRQGYVAGARSDQSNLTLDGVDINEAQSSSLDAPVLRLNYAAIEEFRVQTVNANANQGRSSGAQINLVTKSGTNEYHGSVFHFHRNTIFTANTFFNNRADVDRPKLIRNVFGGAVGGPIVRDRIFFFYNYEGRRDASGAASPLRDVPLPSLGQGLLRYEGTDGSIQTLTTPDLNAALAQACANPQFGPCITPLTINPAAVAAMADAASRYPANSDGVGDGLNSAGFRFNSPIRVGLNSHVGKVDFNVGQNHSFFVRAQIQHDLAGQASFLPDTQAPNLWSHPWGGVIGHTWAMRNNLVNNFRYGYTRQAFSALGDSDENFISFRFIHTPRAFSRTLARVTPVQNITNDTSWVKGNHTIQFGTNIRLIRNQRAGFGLAYDSGVMNPTFYDLSGGVVTTALAQYLAATGRPAMAVPSAGRDAFTTLIGRLSQHSARFTFDRDGSLLPAGSPAERNFATEEYDFYVQDSWRIRRDLTLTFGLRYGLSSPVYEVNGFEVKPNIPLSTLFHDRANAAAAGQLLHPEIILDLSGKANGRSPMYRWDKNNFQPRIAFAWSRGDSVIRGGFALTNDYYGQALAVAFDLNNQLGFAATEMVSANTYNITGRPAPLFTGYNMDLRNLPNITQPTTLVYPQNRPADGARRIESSLDEDLVAPINYAFNLTFEHQLPKRMLFQASYIGRLGRKLLAQRDAVPPLNLFDPVSGMDWYTAATLLEIERQKGTPLSQIQPIAYFENVLANMPLIFGNATVTQEVYDWMCCDNDWTFMQHVADRLTGEDIFFHPQYATLNAWSTIANSNYHALTVSMRQRLSDLTWDFNYTWAHSLDDASGLQADPSFSSSAFIVNPFMQRLSYGNSDFDIRHLININAVYALPIGRGKLLGGDMGRGLDALIGGWQISSIFRWDSGLPFSGPVETGRWPTNWNISSRSVLTQPLQTCPTRGDATDAPNVFGCDRQAAYLSFRNAYPGEIGERNFLRFPGYVAIDFGVGKSVTMPYSEGHKMELRWDIFNATNTQRLTGISTFVTEINNQLNNLVPPPAWGNFTGIQGTPRVMQVGLRYTF